MSDWVATHLWTSTRTLATPYGFLLTTGRYRANLMMQRGTFEADEIAIAQECLLDADIFVDVGANVGYYTCLAGVAGKPVLAFEPQPGNLANLLKNIRQNSLENIEVFPVALGAQPGIAEIFGSSGPSASLLKNWAGYPTRHRQMVSIQRLDDMIASRLLGRRALIKVDVEGFEYQVLLGGQAVLHSEPRPVWLLEICLNEYHPSGSNPDYEKTFSLFFDAGYRVFTADRQRAEVTRADVKQWFLANQSPLGAINYLIRA